MWIITLSLSYRWMVIIIYGIIRLLINHEISLIYFYHISLFEMKQIVQLSKSPISPPTGFKMLKANIRGHTGVLKVLARYHADFTLVNNTGERNIPTNRHINTVAGIKPYWRTNEVNKTSKRKLVFQGSGRSGNSRGR